jgi:hypothetical protein
MVRAAIDLLVAGGHQAQVNRPQKKRQPRLPFFYGRFTDQ